MCGFSVLWVATDWARYYRPLFEANKEAVKYRGPDQQQTIELNLGLSHKLFLFHARLQITGGDQQHQPCLSADGQSGFVYNGEIYNVDELALKFLPNIKQWSRDQYGKITETELLLGLILNCWDAREQWRQAINGMFVIVAWHKGEIWACQDFWQMKPIYMQTLPDGHGFAYCSHPIKLLPAHQMSQEAQVHYLLYRYIRSDLAIAMDDVGARHLATKHKATLPQVSPSAPFTDTTAQVGQVQDRQNTLAGDSFSSQQTFSRSFVEVGVNLESTALSQDADLTYSAPAFEARLVNACISQVCEEYPTGLLLSGGVDSSLLAALNPETQLISAGAYTAIDLCQAITEDAKYAELAASQYHLPWRPVEVGPSLLITHLPNLVAHLELPVADVAGLLTYALCDYAKADGVKVLYSGAGADELFAGYNRHQAYYGSQKAGLVRRLGAKLLVKWPLLPWHKILRHMPQYLARIPQATMLKAPTLPDLLRMQMAWPAAAWQPNLPKLSGAEHFSAGDAIDQLLDHDRQHYLQSQVLMITDRASMAAGVEVRLPYLDQNLSSWALSFGGATHLAKGPKYLLRECLTQNGGERYANRTKQGFGINLDAWMRAPEAEYLHEMIMKQESHLWKTLRHKVVQQLVREHQLGQENHGTQLFALAVYLLWEQKQG